MRCCALTCAGKQLCLCAKDVQTRLALTPFVLGARAMTILTDVAVRKMTQPGLHADGNGLYLSITKTKVEGVFSKSWVVRYTAPTGQRRSMGLGPYPEVTLGVARRQAASLRVSARAGVDPLEERRAKRRETAKRAASTMTFRQCAEGFIETHRHSWRNAKHAAQWRSSLAAYVYPVFGDVDVSQIDTALVARVLDPIWTKKNETASRVRGRIENILDWSKARGHRGGENPARWKGSLQYALPARSKVAQTKHHAALPFNEIGLFLRQLRARASQSAAALEFAILTAARTNEVIGARWEEIDLQAKQWTVPASRMKGGREHRVPLSTSAMNVLTALHADGEHVFTCDGRTPLSNMALLMTLRRMEWPHITVHGFRSTFRDWVAECTDFAREVAEAALAHSVGDKVEAAYRRGDLFVKRTQLMEAWASYCEDRTFAIAGEIVPFDRMSA